MMHTYITYKVDKDFFFITNKFAFDYQLACKYIEISDVNRN